MTRRPRRRVPATLAALVLLAACVLTAIECIQLLAHVRPLVSYSAITAHLHGTHWNQVSPVVAAAVLLALGAIALLAAFLPGRHTLVSLASLRTEPAEPGAPAEPGPAAGPDPMPEAGVTRRGLRTMLGSAAAAVDGVTSVTLGVHRNVVTATVRTLDVSDGVDTAVRTALEQRLDQIQPHRRPTLRIKNPTRTAS